MTDETPRPEPVLHGRLTWLRQTERDDLPYFVRWFNDRHNQRFLGGRGPMGGAMEERWFDRLLERQEHEIWHFVICRLGDDRPIGNLGLFEIDLTNGGAGVGITIDAGVQNRGYGSDALDTVLDFGFGRLRLERIWLDSYDFNERAIRVYERLGFVHEGVSRHGAYRDGRHVDVVQMAILRDEWAARRAADPFPGPWPPPEAASGAATAAEQPERPERRRG